VSESLQAACYHRFFLIDENEIVPYNAFESDIEMFTVAVLYFAIGLREKMADRNII
jgi:hypothetical protein